MAVSFTAVLRRFEYGLFGIVPFVPLYCKFMVVLNLLIFTICYKKGEFGIVPFVSLRCKFMMALNFTAFLRSLQNDEF